MSSSGNNNNDLRLEDLGIMAAYANPGSRVSKTTCGWCHGWEYAGVPHSSCQDKLAEQERAESDRRFRGETERSRALQAELDIDYGHYSPDPATGISRQDADVKAEAEDDRKKVWQQIIANKDEAAARRLLGSDRGKIEWPDGTTGSTTNSSTQQVEPEQEDEESDSKNGGEK